MSRFGVSCSRRLVAPDGIPDAPMVLKCTLFHVAHSPDHNPGSPVWTGVGRALGLLFDSSGSTGGIEWKSHPPPEECHYDGNEHSQGVL